MITTVHSTDLNTFHTPVTADQRFLAKRFYSSHEVTGGRRYCGIEFRGLPL